MQEPLSAVAGTPSQQELEKPTLTGIARFSHLLKRYQFNLALFGIPWLVPIYTWYVESIFGSDRIWLELSLVVLASLPALCYFLVFIPYKGGRVQVGWVCLALLEAFFVYLWMPPGLAYHWRLLILLAGGTILILLRTTTPIRPRAIWPVTLVWLSLQYFALIEPGSSGMPGNRLGNLWLLLLLQAAILYLLRKQEFWLPLSCSLLMGAGIWYFNIASLHLDKLILLFFVWIYFQDTKRSLPVRLLEMVGAVFMTLYIALYSSQPAIVPWMALLLAIELVVLCAIWLSSYLRRV